MQELLEVSLTLELLKAMEVTPCTGSEPGSVTNNAVPQSFGRVAKKDYTTVISRKHLVQKRNQKMLHQ